MENIDINNNGVINQDIQRDNQDGVEAKKYLYINGNVQAKRANATHPEKFSTC